MKMKMIGCDPEVFVSYNGEVSSGIGLIGGTKFAPLKVVNGALQEDNVLAEFNIDPADNKDKFISNIESVLSQLRERLSGRELVVKSSHEFTHDALKSFGLKAFEFGCDPDYNAWTFRKNERPSADSLLRTAGGHVHVSFDVTDKVKDPYLAAIMMDYHLGIPSVLLDSDTRRRSMYGKAGACRPKLIEKGDAYDGVEYRSLSNFWLANRNLMSWVFDNTQTAILRMEELEHTVGSNVERVQHIINNSDAKEAQKFISEYDIIMPELRVANA